MMMKKSRFSNLVVDRCVACALLFSRAVDSMSRLSPFLPGVTQQERRGIEKTRERERETKGGENVE